jgi:CRISPR-associated protein Cmr5
VNVQTTSQRMAQAAYNRIRARKLDEPYRRFARDFPMLIHSCGLAQSLAFALARKEHHAEYAEDLARVLAAAGHEQIHTAKQLADRIRDELWVTQYIRISRDALAAAVWLKRYVEAAGEGETPKQGTGS